jgi:hypothetical protein
MTLVAFHNLAAALLASVTAASFYEVLRKDGYKNSQILTKQLESIQGLREKAEAYSENIQKEARAIFDP